MHGTMSLKFYVVRMLPVVLVNTSAYFSLSYPFSVRIRTAASRLAQ